jgi:hypothetical protein
MARPIDLLLEDARSRLEPLLQEAFEAGRAFGHQEASVEFQSKIAAVFGLASSGEPPRTNQLAVVGVQPVPSPAAPPPEEGRAAPGSVKPVILNLLATKSAFGITMDEIVQATGIKYNSVRGTLYTLKQNGEAHRIGLKWFRGPHPDGEVSEAAVSEAEENKMHDADSNKSRQDAILDIYLEAVGMPKPVGDEDRGG